MKSIKILFPALIIALFFVSCKSDIEYQIPEEITVNTTVDFENVKLNSDSIWNGSDGSGYFSTKMVQFNNSYYTAWFSWSGFSCSSKKDIITPGFANQYSVSAGSGADGSQKFALAYGSATIVCDSNVYGNYSIKSMKLTNSTYAFLEMKNGSNYSKKFTSGDWFKVNIKGYLNGVKTDSVDYYLADFRDGKSFLSNTWNKVDVSKLGKVDKITFNFDSSDKGTWGINTPTYVCIDDIEFSQTFSTK